LLANHEDIDCGPETHFYSKTSRQELDRLAQEKSWPDKGLQILEELTLANQSVLQLYKVSREKLRSALLEKTPGSASTLEALMECMLRQSGKSIWLEKTPNHLLHLERIRADFPQARILRITRDPRDSCLSMRKLAWCFDEPFLNSYLIQDWHKRSHSFFDFDPLTFSIRYEDLIENTQSVLESACSFLNIDFQESMLNTRGSSTRVSSKAEWWKQQVSGSINKSLSGRWIREMHAEIAKAIEIQCSDFMHSHRYSEKQQTLHNVAIAPPDRIALEINADKLAKLARNGLQTNLSDRPIKDERLLLLLKSQKTRYRQLLSDSRCLAIAICRFLCRKPTWLIPSKRAKSFRFILLILSTLNTPLQENEDRRDFTRTS